MNEKQYGGVDIAKFLCSIAIVCIHWEPFTSVNGLLNSFTVNFVSRLAVPLFFIASGFFLFRKTDLHALDFGVIRAYIFKILKFYLIWSAIYFPFTVREMLYAGDASGRLKVLLSWAKNMIFTAGYGFLWYLPATAVAVLIVGFLLKRGLKPRTVVGIGVGLYMIGLLGQSYFGLIRWVEQYPALWSFLKGFHNTIVTTRNGVFEGVVFIAMGAMLAKRDSKPRLGRDIVAFLLSMACLFGEIIFVTKMNWKLGYDMYLALLPAAFFLFRIAMTVNVKNAKLCCTLRTYSSLIYYSHMLIVELLLCIPVIASLHSTVAFLAVLGGTLVLDTLILRLSRLKAFAYLKNLYT